MFIKDKIIKDWRFISIFLIFLIFLLLRLYRLGSHDLWFDEFFSLSYTKDPQALGYVRYPQSFKLLQAPFYYILLEFFIKILGISEFTLRLPSVIFSYLSIILLFFFAKELFNKKIAIIASLLMGFSPFHLWYAQEARSYSTLLFLGVLSNFFLWKALKNGKNNLWLFFASTSLAGIYTHYFYLFLFFAQVFYLIIVKKARFNFKIIICFLIVVLGFSFYFSEFFSSFFFIRQGFWIPKPEWNSLIITLENFILGYNGTGSLYFVLNILIGVLLINAFLNIRSGDLRRSFIFCIFLSLIPIICVFFFSRVYFSVYLDRCFIIFSPYYYLILSFGIVFLGKWMRRSLIVVVIFMLLICDYRYFKDWLTEPLKHHVGTYIKRPVKPLVKFLDNKAERNDIIAFTNPSIMFLHKFYTQKKNSLSYYFFDPHILESCRQRPVLEDEYRLPFSKISKLKFKSLWIVFSDWDRNGGLDENSHSVKKWLDGNLKLVFIKEIDGVLISKYVKK